MSVTGSVSSVINHSAKKITSNRHVRSTLETAPIVLSHVSKMCGMSAYILPEYEHHLHDYEYKSVGCTVIDSLLDVVWWEPLSSALPDYVHPNLLTLTALIFSFCFSYWPQAVVNNEGLNACSSWVYLLCGISFFTYQTLDALDGKQARRLGLSSAIGQIFDHGCDAVTTYYGLFIIMSTVQFGYGPACALALQSVSFQLLFYTWYEFEYGVFKSATNRFCGVTEAQLLVIILNIFSAIVPSFWGATFRDGLPGFLAVFCNFPPFNTKFSSLIFYPSTIIMLGLNIQEAITVLREKGVRHSGETAEIWMILGVHFVAQALYCISGSLSRHPIAVTMILALYGAGIIWRFMLSSLSHTPLRLITPGTLPFYAFSMALASGLLGTGTICGLFVYIFWVYSVGYHLLFAFVNLDLMKRVLGVRLFTVPDLEINPIVLDSTHSKTSVPTIRQRNVAPRMNRVSADAQVEDLIATLKSLDESISPDFTKTNYDESACKLKEELSGDLRTAIMSECDAIGDSKDGLTEPEIMSREGSYRSKIAAAVQINTKADANGEKSSQQFGEPPTKSQGEKKEAAAIDILNILSLNGGENVAGWTSSEPASEQVSRSNTE